MKLKVDFSELHRACAKVNGPDYLQGFDDAAAGLPYNDSSAKSKLAYEKGFKYVGNNMLITNPKSTSQASVNEALD
ncbi:hypothetical protein [Aliidiomarina quisquiliarum]|uniref:hypothetical protein n=1 Tax=Aliidiomarina quisquiliarum TaxID=2938947 RepID=UPI00208ECFDD|nr:hypothetical protein [Aliidiomarina quisquiliarum]MCO4320349.1 hypothetical protein [Aliidiomarina quisquiliarum]